MQPSGQENSFAPPPDIPPCGVHRDDQADTPAEAAIVQHMRESGTLPAWEMSYRPPDAAKTVSTITLTLAGGLRISTDDEYHYRCIFASFPRETTQFPMDAPLALIAAELPARLLPVLRAAVADLERRVAGAEG